MSKKHFLVTILSILVVAGLMFSLANADTKKDPQKKKEKKCIPAGIHIDLSGLTEGLKALENLDLRLEGLENMHLRLQGLKALKNLDVRLHGLQDRLKVLDHIDIDNIVHKSLRGLRVLENIDLGGIINDSIGRGLEALSVLNDFDFDFDWDDDDDFILQKKDQSKKKKKK